MVRADYVYRIIGNNTIVNIVDLNKGNMSVTNDAENVLTEINSIEEIKNKRIVYLDSEDNVDEIVPVWKGEECINVSFKPYVV